MSALCFAAAILGATAMSETDAYEHRAHRHTGGEYKDEEFKYRLMSPAKLEKGKKYPVVLFLHGAGERGDDNEAQLKYLPTWMAEKKMREKYPCFLIAPQCRKDRTWTVADWTVDESPAMPKEPTDQMKVAIAILDAVMKSGQPVDEERVYLTGLSMGGFGAWELALREPDRFAAVAPICGGGDETQAKRLVGLPVWAWHGSQDKAVALGHTVRMVEAIKKAGGKPKFTILTDVGHDSWTPAYTREDGVIPWMFEQAKKK